MRATAANVRVSEVAEPPAVSETKDQRELWHPEGKAANQKGGSVSIAFTYSSVTDSSLQVWRHIATSQSHYKCDVT